MDEQYRQFEGMRKFRPLDHVLFLLGKKKKISFGLGIVIVVPQVPLERK